MGSIVGDPAFKNLLEGRITELRKSISRSRDATSVAMMNTSLFRMTGGVALIHIGSTSSESLDSKLLALEDGISSVSSSRHSGSSLGGGTTLVRIAMSSNSGIRGNQDEASADLTTRAS